MTDPKAAAMSVVLREQPPSLDRPANILRTLLVVEQEVGYVPMEAIASIAKRLGVTEADVLGVLSYYPDLHTAPRGRHIVRLCTGEACVANGSLRLLTELYHKLDMKPGETSADGQFTSGTGLLSRQLRSGSDSHGGRSDVWPRHEHRVASDSGGSRRHTLKASQPLAMQCEFSYGDHALYFQRYVGAGGGGGSSGGGMGHGSGCRVDSHVDPRRVLSRTAGRARRPGRPPSLAAGQAG